MAHFSIKAAHAETDEMRELAEDAGAADTTPQIGAEEGEAVIVGRFSPRSRIQPGQEVAAVVDTRALHFFDPGTGNGIYDSEKGD
jgi:multiple sugar transport system ATP-binding protein